MTKLPRVFRRIHLELAREPGHPSGDPHDRYTLIAPLDSADRVDAAVWREHRDACRVVHEHQGETVAGLLVREPGGSWRFRYGDGEAEDEERAYRFGDEQLRPGEYVSISREDGTHPYRVTAVAPL